MIIVGAQKTLDYVVVHVYATESGLSRLMHILLPILMPGGPCATMRYCVLAAFFFRTRTHAIDSGERLIMFIKIHFVDKVCMIV